MREDGAGGEGRMRREEGARRRTEDGGEDHATMHMPGPRRRQGGRTEEARGRGGERSLTWDCGSEGGDVSDIKVSARRGLL